MGTVGAWEVWGYFQKQKIPAQGELFFCLAFCLDSFIQGKICLVRAALLEARLDLLGTLLTAPDWLWLLLPPVLLDVVLPLPLVAVMGLVAGETGGGGWCS